VTVEFAWRGEFSNDELNALHAQGFGHRLYAASECDRRSLVERHSLGWGAARQGDMLVGFVNVPWDGFVHAWIQDVVVAEAVRHHGIGTKLVAVAREHARAAGCEWLHVDFDPDLEAFYRACGFTPTAAGLIKLR
jgi:GNAT superfamily N-acetyltransferase